jgi:hypothetical protein
MSVLSDTFWEIGKSSSSKKNRLKICAVYPRDILSYWGFHFKFLRVPPLRKGGPIVFNILAKIVNPYLKQKGKTVILIWRRKKTAN